MVPHQTNRGKNALKRLKVFEGCPPPFDNVKRLCVPIAMKVLCLRSDRKFCKVGRVAHEVGWQYKDVVANLEAKRKIKSRLAYLHKKKLKVSVLRISGFSRSSNHNFRILYDETTTNTLPTLFDVHTHENNLFADLFLRYITPIIEFYFQIYILLINKINFTFLCRPSQGRHAPRSPKRSSHRMQFLNNMDILHLRQSKKIFK